MHYHSSLVKILTGLRPVFSEIQLTINIIFYQRNIVFCNDLNQFLFLFVGDATTKRIVKVWHYDASLDITFTYCFLQAVQIDSIDSTGCNFYHLQAKTFSSLVDPKISWALNRYRIPGTGHSPQTHGYCL